jgi:NADPH-dependent glutamate synthase beta subunit-like oxidoreductase
MISIRLPPFLNRADEVSDLIGQGRPARIELLDGARVAVIGGGPAGASFVFTF